VLVEGGADEELVVADVEYTAVQETRANYPFLADRRGYADTYASRPY
jgi:predicted amidohydrolase